MAKELKIAIQVSKNSLEKSLTAFLKGQKAIDLQVWTSDMAESGPSAIKDIPEIIIIDDTSATDDLVLRVRQVVDFFPQSTVFVISKNQDPKTIIAVMKAGAAEFLVEPLDEQTLHHAIEEVRSKKTGTLQLSNGRIFSFMSAKGGVGSTVLAVNSATALALNKKSSVALLDMSFQSGDTSVLLDIVPQNTIVDICKNLHRLDLSFLRGVMTSHNTGLNYLPAPLNPEDSEEITEKHVSMLLHLSRSIYDHVVIDCTSMHVNDSSIETFKMSDKVFIVTDMSVPSIRNTVRLCTLIRKFGIGLDKIEIVVNRFIKGGDLTLAEIEKNFDKPVYWVVPNDFSNVVSSINRGVPLVKFSANSPFSKNVLQFVKKFQGLLSDQNFRGIRGTFGKTI
jgi:pilus assembly protein CpaE